MTEKENNLQNGAFPCPPEVLVLGARPIGPGAKGVAAGAAGLAMGQVREQGWKLLDEQVSLPVAVLNQAALQHNLQWMAAFIGRYGLKLAPHGKTSMSPALFDLQLAAGSWGLTLASAPQVQLAHRAGVQRVIMASQLVGRANMAMIAAALRDPAFRFWVIVDSPDNVHALGQYFAEQGLRLNLLLELGVAGGRTGVRDDRVRDQLLEAIAAYPASLVLAGIEIYEGVLSDAAAVRAFVARAADQLRQLAAQGAFASNRLLLTGAGSAWFDLVAEAWSGLKLDQPLDIVLRPGCYLTHDVGIYRAAEQRMAVSNPVVQSLAPGLRPALQVWAYVVSRPEPGLAILGLGKRDAAFDAGLPVPALVYRPGTLSPQPAPAHWQLTRMMDQHAFLQLPAAADLKVGDMLALDISHPCLTFDKWRQLLVVDDDWRVVDAVETFF